MPIHLSTNKSVISIYHQPIKMSTQHYECQRIEYYLRLKLGPPEIDRRLRRDHGHCIQTLPEVPAAEQGKKATKLLILGFVSAAKKSWLHAVLRRKTILQEYREPVIGSNRRIVRGPDQCGRDDRMVVGDV